MRATSAPGPELRIDPVQTHDVALAREHIELRGAVSKNDLAALREHDVVIELVREALHSFNECSKNWVLPSIW